MIKSKNIILKIFLAMLTIAFISFGASILSACEIKDDDDVVRITPSVNNRTYYTTEKLEDIGISLAQGDTAGVIEWVDDSLTITKGVSSYAYKFTPNDLDEYEVTYGTILITGYEVVDLTDLTLPAITVTYSGKNVSDVVEIEGMDNYTCILSTNKTDVGQYETTVIIKSNDEYIYLKDGDSAPTKQLATKTCQLTIEKLQLNQNMLTTNNVLVYNAEYQIPTNVVKNKSTIIDSENYDVVVKKYKAENAIDFADVTNAKYPGEYKATVVGKNNLDGQAEIDFSIVKADGYNLTIQSTNESQIIAGSTVSDIPLTKVEGMSEFYWDTNDIDYHTKLVVGENYRKAIIREGEYFNECEITVKIIADKAFVDNALDLVNSIALADVTLTGSIRLDSNLTIPKNRTLTINEDTTLIVNKGCAITVESGAKIVNNGTILRGKGYGEIVAEVESDLDLRNDHVYFVTKYVLQKNITTEQAIKYIAEKPIDCVLDLNGHNINNGLYFKNQEHDFSFKIMNSKSSGGMISSVSTETTYALAILCKGNVNIECENVNFKSDSYYALVTNGSYKNANLSFKNCRFICDDEGTAAYLPATYVCTFENCEFSAGTGLYIKGGDTSIINCEINATGTKSNFTSANDGFYETGDGIAIETNTAYDKDMDVVITNTTIRSRNGFTIQENGEMADCTTSIILDQQTRIGTKSADGTITDTPTYYTKNDIIKIV